MAFHHKNAIITGSTDMIHTQSMAIGAHPDDCEIIGIKGIADKQFFAVIVTHGATMKDDVSKYNKTIHERACEQASAAALGQYLGYSMLGYDSTDILTYNTDLIDDLTTLLLKLKPETIYTHCLSDKHSTHVAVAYHVIRALQLLPIANKPTRVYGCEVWRDLDWVDDADKVLIDTSDSQDLQYKLLQCFTSQTTSKDYPKAVIARQNAHAVFQDAYASKTQDGVLIAIDLTLLIYRKKEHIKPFIERQINTFKDDVITRINTLTEETDL